MKYTIKDFADGKIVVHTTEAEWPEFVKAYKAAGCKHDRDDHRADGCTYYNGLFVCGAWTGPRSKPVVEFRDLTLLHTPADFYAGRIGIRCETRAEYDALMRECEGKGLVWGSNQPIAAEWEMNFRPGASYTLGDPSRRGRLAYCFPPCDCHRTGDCGHRNSVPFSAVFPDPWAEFVAGKCYLRVTKDEWPEFAKRCEAAGIKWPEQRASEKRPYAFDHSEDAYVFVDHEHWHGFLNAMCGGAPTDKPIHPFSAIARLKAELHPAARKIVITTDGKTTTATLYEGKQTVKTATATCSPTDAFDFNRGAALACSRLTLTPEWAAWYEEKAAVLDELAAWLKGAVK